MLKMNLPEKVASGQTNHRQLSAALLKIISRNDQRKGVFKRQQIQQKYHFNTNLAINLHKGRYQCDKEHNLPLRYSTQLFLLPSESRRDFYQQRTEQCSSLRKKK